MPCTFHVQQLTRRAMAVAPSLPCQSLASSYKERKWMNTFQAFLLSGKRSNNTQDCRCSLYNMVNISSSEIMKCREGSRNCQPVNRLISVGIRHSPSIKFSRVAHACGQSSPGSTSVVSTHGYNTMETRKMFSILLKKR